MTKMHADIEPLFGAWVPSPEPSLSTEQGATSFISRRRFILLSAVGIAGLGAGAAIWRWNWLFGKRKWKYIVIHHSASLSGNAETFEEWHRKRGMRFGMAYHFVIGNGNGLGDGEVETGVRWKRQLWGGHLRGWQSNLHAIGICLVGNFETGACTDRQFESLQDLTSKLMARHRIPASAVRGHREMPGEMTLCPGKRFNMNRFRNILI